MTAGDRRYWKLAVIKTLSGAGFHVATIRRTIGSPAFNALLDHAYDASTDPVGGAEIVRAELEERYGDLLDRPIMPWSRKP